MNTAKLAKPKNPIDGVIQVPGCLSYTTRALVLAALTKNKVEIINPVKSDDSYAMLKILSTLGIKTEETKNSFVIHGNIDDIEPKEYKLNVNISGRTARSSLAFLCVTPGTKTITCQEAFKKRPVGDLVGGLRQLGAKIEYLEKEGHLPVKILSDKLNSGKVKMRGEVSSQYFSAIMMIAPIVGKIEIEVLGNQASKSFIDMTIQIMEEFGVKVKNQDYKKYIVEENQNYKKETYINESDATASGYFWGLAAISGGRARMPNLSPKSKQGDIQLVDFLGQMGCKVRKNDEENWIEVEGTDKLKGIECDMSSCPDAALTLITVAAFAEGETKISGLETLPFKECDRIQTPAAELKKMGIETETTTDSIIIKGGCPKHATINTYDDHRMAMAFAIMAGKIDKMSIEDPQVVNKSFPNFWNKLKELGFGFDFE